MKRTLPITRIWALSLALTLALPNPAFALREQEPTETEIHGGLEEALKSGKPEKIAEAAVAGVAHLFASTQPSSETVSEPISAGLEEEGIIPLEQARNYLFEVGEKSLWLSRARELGIRTQDGFYVSGHYSERDLGIRPLQDTIERRPHWRTPDSDVNKIVEKLRKTLKPYLEGLRTPSNERFGDPENPLLLAVRSDADYPYPGLLTTILFVGLTEETIGPLSVQLGEDRAYGMYSRFLRGFGTGVFRIPDEDFQLALEAHTDPRDIARAFRQLIERNGFVIPQDSHEQLAWAIAAVLESADTKAVRQYRMRVLGIAGSSYHIRSGALIQPMLATLGENAGVGFFETHNSRTGATRLSGQVLLAASGDDLMRAGSKLRWDMNELAQRFPGVYSQLGQIRTKLLKRFGIPFAVEFAFADGAVTVLQVTPMSLAASVANRVLEHMVRPNVGGLVNLGPALAEIGKQIPQKGVSQYRWRSTERPPKVLFSGGQTRRQGIAVGQLIEVRHPVEELEEPSILIPDPSTHGNTLIRLLASGQIAGLIVGQELGIHERQLVESLGIPMILMGPEELAEVSRHIPKGQKIILDAGERKAYEYALQMLVEETAPAVILHVRDLEREVLEKYSGMSYAYLLKYHTDLMMEVSDLESAVRQKTSTAEELKDFRHPEIEQLLNKTLEAHFIHEQLKERGRQHRRSPEQIQDDLQRELAIRDVGIPYSILSAYQMNGIESSKAVVVFFDSGAWDETDASLVPKEEAFQNKLSQETGAAREKVRGFLAYLIEADPLAASDLQLKEWNQAYMAYHSQDRVGWTGRNLVGIEFPFPKLAELKKWLERYEAQREGKQQGKQTGLEEVQKALKALVASDTVTSNRSEALETLSKIVAGRISKDSSTGVLDEVGRQLGDLLSQQTSASSRVILVTKAESWPKDSSIGSRQAVFLGSQGRIATGLAFTFDLTKVWVQSWYNPEILKKDLPLLEVPQILGGLRPPAKGSRKFDNLVKELRRKARKSNPRLRLLYATNSHQANLYQPAGFLIVGGNLKRKADGKRGLFQEVYQPLEGEHTVLVLDPPEKRGVRKITIRDGDLVPEGILHAINGPPLLVVENGEAVDKSGEIRPAPEVKWIKDDGTILENWEEGAKRYVLDWRPDTVGWDPQNTATSFSAVGMNSKGYLVSVAMIGKVSAADMAATLKELGAQEAILLGGSQDVHQWWEDGTLRQAPSRPHPARWGGTQRMVDWRPMNTALLVYASPSLKTGLEERMTRREFLTATVGTAAGLAVQQLIATSGVDKIGIARHEAVDAWARITAIPSSQDTTKRLLPIFYALETFHAIPFVAKTGSPFLVIAASQAEEDGIRALLDDLKTSRDQYLIRRSDLEKMDRPASLAKVLQEFTHDNTYPIDPSRPAWFEELLAQLQQKGIIPIGDLTPALQATERYFRTLA